MTKRGEEKLHLKRGKERVCDCDYAHLMGLLFASPK
jgi:hypothetical protein